VQFFPQFFASTFENWQSEFLQLVWQAVGLALLWGSRPPRDRRSPGRLGGYPVEERQHQRGEVLGRGVGGVVRTSRDDGELSVGQ
jgi:hypothetical protein